MDRTKVAMSLQMILENICWFFCVHINCVDTSCSSSSKYPSSISINGLLWQRNWWRKEKHGLSLFITLLWNCKIINFIWPLLLVANPSRASLNDSTKCFAICKWNCKRRLFLQPIRGKLKKVLERACCFKSSIGIKDCVFLQTEWFKIKDCHVFEELSVVGVRDTERV